jgi:tetratricopeptide (TPR) repeat protein
MSQAPSTSDDLLSAAALLRVDEVCVRFEDSWKKGQRPCLEAFLAGTCGPVRMELLRELLRLERCYRQNLGEPVAAREYEGRFPEDVALIRSVLAEGLTVGPAAARAEGTGPEAAPQEPRGGADAGEPRFPSVPGYEILAELGRGGMGVVYQARHTALRRLVALKMILSGDYASREQLDRFQREAEAVARLRHPNVVQVYEVGEVRGSPFLSLEFVDGGSLARHIAGTPQPPHQAADLIATLTRAMHAAHQAGVVHRDLKPANVLLGRKPDAAETAEPTLEAFEPKISDFGLAKRLDGESEHTHTGAIMGTASYMAPEQAEGRAREVGPAADVYALAAILYELLTGRPPFKGATVRDTIEQVCTREPVPPTQLQPKVPRDLETICLKGLRKDIRQRYATAQDLADDLQRWLGGRPILARPVAAWERAWKWARRRPALAGLAVALLVAVLAGTASAVLYGLYEHQKAAAQEREAKGSRTVQDLYARGHQAETAGQFNKAKGHYDQALATLNHEPGAAGEDMRHLLEDGIQRVSQRQEEKGRLAERQVFAEHLKTFRGHYDQVRFHTVGFRDEDAADHAAAVRQEAPEALKRLDLDPSSAPQRLAQGLEPFRPLVNTPDQLNRLAEECVEVLLAWADAEAITPAPGGPKQALRLLDSAAALGRAHGLATSRAWHVRRAKCLELLGDAKGARAEHSRADDITPTNALDLVDVALTSYRTGRVTDAGVACAKVLRLESGHFWAQYLRALCYLQEKRWGEAEVGLNACLGRKSDFPWLLPLLGIAHMGLKQYDAAEADFAQALGASSEPALRALALTNRSALRLLQGRDLQVLPAETVTSLATPDLACGITQLFTLKRFQDALARRDDAERDLREVIKLQPNVYQGYITLADLLKARGGRPEAFQVLNEALVRCPDKSALYFERALLHAENHDPAAAQRDFKQAIAKELAGSKSDRVLAARVELAHLHSLEGDHEAALADCNAVLAARPNFPEAHRQRAEALLGLGKKKEARAALDQYLKVGGKPTPAAHRARGLLYAKEKDYRAAVKAYSQALLLKEDAETLSDRGWAYLVQEAVRPALDDFDAALELNPKSAHALAGRGTALVLRGRPADVVKATDAAEQSLRSERITADRLLVCARIYTRAAALLEPTPRRWPLDSQAERYRQRALELLRQARALVPEKEQPAFWRDSVRGDPALLPLLRAYGR